VRARERRDDPPAWEVVRRDTLHDCRVFRIERAMTRSPHTAGTHAFFTIDADAWVNVVATTARAELVMVRQWRHGARKVTLEIPGGLVDPGEEPAAAAARELLEETGFAAPRMRPLGAANPNPALFGNRVHTFLAEDCERVSEVKNGPLEETWVELVPEHALPARLRAGDIDHALVIAALHWWRLHRDAAAG